MSEKTTPVELEKDEWWPVYSVSISADSSHYGTKVELPESLIKRAVDAFAEFEAVQRELQRYFEATR